MSGDVDDLVTYFIMTCNDNTSVDKTDCVTHIKGLQEIVTFFLKVMGVNFITST